MKALPVVAALIIGLVVGCGGGFLLGLLATKGGRSFVESLASNEQKADVGASKTIQRDAFRVEYPGNWKLDVEDEDYDADRLFSIDSPGSCHVNFIFFDVATTAADSTESQVSAFTEKIVKGATQTPFDRWGRYEGSGVKLEGRIMTFQGSVRIFSHSSEEKDVTFTAVEFCFEEDMKSVQPGFDLIERTFTLQ